MKSKIRWSSVLLALILSLVIGFSSSSSQTEAAKKEIPLKIGMEANYPLYNRTQTTDANGAVPIDGPKQYANGYDIQIAKIIGKKFHRKAVVERTGWDGLSPVLTSGRIDLITAGMSPTAEHRKAINFFVPYRESIFVVITSKTGKFTQAKGSNDFKGAKLTAQQSTLHYDLIKQLHGAKRELAMRSFSAMRQSLRSGTIGGYVAEDIEYQSYRAVDPNTCLLYTSSSS